MTSKKRVIVSLSDEAYFILCNSIGSTFYLNERNFTVESKSKLIEELLLEVGKDLVIK